MSNNNVSNEENTDILPCEKSQQTRLCLAHHRQPRQNGFHGSIISDDLLGIMHHRDSLFVWGFTLYQQYFSYLMATVHKSMFPGLCLTST